MQKLLAAILCLLAACEPPPGPARPKAPLLRPAAIPSGATAFRVKSVYDGDTLTLENGKKVRLLGVDTPELKGEGGGPDNFAPEARDFTRSLCDGREAWLEFDTEKEDAYGRWLCFVYVREGDSVRMVNAELLREGLARLYTPGPNALHKELLLACQREARENARGSWKDYVLARDKQVVATRSGHAYHRAECDALRNSKNLRTLSVNDALDAGLSACRTCKP